MNTPDPTTAGIVLLDDDPFMLKLLTHMLAQLGYTRVVACESGQKALTLIQGRETREAVDLIFLDINMPGMGGLAACKAIRTDANVAIIMLTVHNAESDKVEALDAGADDFVTKPFSTKELAATVAAFLSQPGDHRDLP